MKEMTLLGLPEGIVGRSVVAACSKEDLLARYPALRAIAGKLLFDNGIVRAYSPCDG